MNIKVYIILTLLWVSSIHVVACSCPSISKDDDFLKSDFIGIGYVIGNYDTIADVLWQETFKGYFVPGDTIEIDMSGYCSAYLQKGQKWLLYGDIASEGTLSISFCSWSRSFDLPYAQDSRFMPVPLTKEQHESDNGPLLRKFSEYIAYAELVSDIENLRGKKVRESLTLVRTELRTLKDRMLYIQLGSFVVTLIVIVVLFYRKK